MAESPFASLDAYVAVPRLTDLALSPDGRRLVAAVADLAPDGTRYRTALWEIDQAGGPPRRLTRSAAGDSAPAFLPSGDLLFVSARTDPDDTGARAAENPDSDLWLLPASGGEGRRGLARTGGGGSPLLARAGGVERPFVARDAGTVVVLARVLPGPAEQDEQRRQRRRDGGVSAILHEDLPVRHWDHDLGPGRLRLLAVDNPAEPTGWRLRDLTPAAGNALEEVGTVVSADGATVYTGWRVTHPGGRESARVLAIDVATGATRQVAAHDADPAAQHDYGSPAVAPDGRWVAVVDVRTETPERAPTMTLTLVDVASGERRDLLPEFPLWPAAPVVAADSTAVLFTAEEAGHAPVWRVDVRTGELTRLTASGSYTHLCPTPDGRSVFALRSHVDSPPRVVRLDAHAPDQQPSVLDAPGAVAALPGQLTEIHATAPDGAPVRGWLALPDSADPAPLLLWVHGGPLSSWHGWSWRWNPWLMVQRGWAVLMPDPGLSRGYGDGFVQRAWGNWGPVPFTDLMAITDAAEGHERIDATRTAAMGGSYGGYMANWIAGHTDRFRAIVTHASLWSLEPFARTTDHPGSWALEWGYPGERPEFYARNTPQAHADNIRTPMLVIHGDRDYRVPIGEGLALWADLRHRQVDAKFLYFPDEGHWILKPGNVKAWYETVWAFLDQHVLGQPWQRPELL